MTPAIAIAVIRLVVALGPEFWKLYKAFKDSGLDIDDFEKQRKELDKIDVDSILDGGAR